MQDFVFCIPTYHRERVLTIDKMLQSLGYPKDRIIVSTQCQEDFAKMVKIYRNMATVIYREGSCVGDNRNNLLQYCQQNGIQRLVMIDDDVQSIFTAVKSRSTVQRLSGDRATFDSFISENIYELMHTACARLCGGYMCDNPLSMTKKIENRSLLIGRLLFFADSGLRFDRRYVAKEDYELCCRLLQNGEQVLRLNYLAAQSSKQDGGCSDVWNGGGGGH